MLCVVWKNEISFIFIVCLLGLSCFAERGDGACIDHSIAVTLPRFAGSLCPSKVFWREVAIQAASTLFLLQTWSGLIDKCLLLLGGLDIVFQRDVKH